MRIVAGRLHLVVVALADEVVASPGGLVRRDPELLRDLARLMPAEALEHRQLALEEPSTTTSGKMAASSSPFESCSATIHCGSDWLTCR